MFAKTLGLLGNKARLKPHTPSSTLECLREWGVNIGASTRFRVYSRH